MATKGKKVSTVPEGYVSANVQIMFWKPKDEGDTIAGFYQGERNLPAKGKYKAQTVFDVADENGELFALTGASLIRQFERIEEGQEVIVVFHGRKAMTDGRAPMKEYAVYGKGTLRPFKKETD